MMTTATLDTVIKNSQSFQMTSLTRAWFLTSFVILPRLALCGANDSLFQNTTTLLSTEMPTVFKQSPVRSVGYSREKFEQYRNGCVPFQRFVLGLCLSIFSCFGKCGQADSGCSCDQYCTVYQDCCWDFGTHCPIERQYARRHLRYLQDFEVSCVDKRNVVVGCGKNTGHRPTGQADHREPMVSYGGLLFVNRTTMESCSFGGVKGNKLFLMKRIALPQNESVAILRSFFLTGYKEDRVQISDFSSPASSFRDCPASVEVGCDFDALSKKCFVPHQIRIGHASILCALDIIEGNNDSIPSVSTPETTSIYTTGPSHIHDSILNVNTPETIRIYTNGPSHIQEQPECHFKPEDTRFPLPVNDLSTAGVVLTYSYGIVNTPTIISSVFVNTSEDSLNRYLQSITCDEIPQSHSCNIRIDCIDGFLPISLVCREPYSINIQVYGENKYPVLKIIPTVIFSIIFKYYKDRIRLTDRLKLLPSREVQVESGYMSVTEYIGIQRLLLDYDGEILPVTKKVLEMLQDQQAVLHVKTISICVGIKRLNQFEKCLLCDRLTTESTGHLTFLDHRTISGSSQLPFPDDDKPASSRSQGHRTTLPLFVMVFCQTVLYMLSS